MSVVISATKENMIVKVRKSMLMAGKVVSKTWSVLTKYWIIMRRHDKIGPIIFTSYIPGKQLGKLLGHERQPRNTN